MTRNCNTQQQQQQQQWVHHLFRSFSYLRRTDQLKPQIIKMSAEKWDQVEASLNDDDDRVIIPLSFLTDHKNENNNNNNIKNAPDDDDDDELSSGGNAAERRRRRRRSIISPVRLFFPVYYFNNLWKTKNTKHYVSRKEKEPSSRWYLFYLSVRDSTLRVGSSGGPLLFSDVVVVLLLLLLLFLCGFNTDMHGYRLPVASVGFCRPLRREYDFPTFHHHHHHFYRIVAQSRSSIPKVMEQQQQHRRRRRRQRRFECRGKKSEERKSETTTIRNNWWIDSHPSSDARTIPGLHKKEKE